LLSVLALTVSYGAAWLWRATPQIVWANGVAVIAGLFLVLAGGGLLKEAQARLTSMTRGERSLSSRLSVMRGTIAEKVALYYPLLDRDYRFVAALSNRTSAAHVLVTYPMFRFFERGAHALSLWPFDRVKPGDVFASHEYHEPPADQRWVLLSRHPGYRVWVNVAVIEPVRAAVVNEADGRVSRLMHPVAVDEIGPDGLIVWRATVPGGGGQPKVLHEHTEALRLDDELTSSACEALDTSPSGQSCSGVVAIARDAIGGYASGQLSVGVELSGDPTGVTLSVARLRRPSASPQ
jgi:hypothetical protein